VRATLIFVPDNGWGWGWGALYYLFLGLGGPLCSIVKEIVKEGGGGREVSEGCIVVINVNASFIFL